MAKTVLISGANKGIGFATAEKFSDEGYNVIMTGRSRAKIEEALKRINRDNCKGLVWDVSKVSSDESVLNEAHELFGDIDTFINNAGIVSKEDFNDGSAPTGLLHTTEAGWDETMNVNLKGTYFAIQAETKYMITHGIKGHIVNLCSEVAFEWVESMYTVSKWGVRCMTGGLAPLLAKYGIILNAVAPGQTATEILYQKENEAVKNNSPRGVRAMPYEIAKAIFFLANDDNMIGTVLLSDGGNSMR